MTENEVGGMDLEEFVAGVLTSILRGVATARTDGGVGALVAPPFSRFSKSGEEALLYKTDDEHAASAVQFDVAVVVDRSKSGGAGLRVPFVSVGGKVDAATSITSRVQFTVPVVVAKIGDAERSRREAASEPLPNSSFFP